jgi:hypothetical protein
MVEQEQKGVMDPNPAPTKLPNHPSPPMASDLLSGMYSSNETHQKADANEEHDQLYRDGHKEFQGLSQLLTNSNVNTGETYFEGCQNSNRYTDIKITLR